MQLRYERSGEGSAVVILHGLLGSSENWRVIRKALAARHEVICVDLPNHGGSYHTRSYTLESICVDLVETLTVLKVERATVVGHSLGGKVAMHLAATRPDLVVGLIVVDMSPRALQPLHLFILRACIQLNLSRAVKRGDLDKELAQWIPMAETRAFLLKNVVRGGDGTFWWRVPLDYIIDNYRIVSDAVKFAAPYPGATLFITGGNSPFRVMADRELIDEWFPEARFVEIAEAKIGRAHV